MTIERALTTDFLSIAELDRSAWQQNRNSEFIPDGEHVWRIWVEHALVFTAKTVEGRVVGAILAFPCISGKYCVHKVFVDKRHRATGIGGRLFAVLLNEIDRLKADCFLTVDPENEAARRLYRTWGFTDEELVKGFYRAHEPRYVLTRRFRPPGE